MSGVLTSAKIPRAGIVETTTGASDRMSRGERLCHPLLDRRGFLLATGGWLLTCSVRSALADDVKSIDPQPYFANVRRAIEALEKLGAPITDADAQQLAELASQSDSTAVSAAEEIMGRYTIANLLIESESALRITSGGAPPTLIEQGWRMFLVRAANPRGLTDNIWLSSGDTLGQIMASGSHSAQRADPTNWYNKAPLIEKMWLLSRMYETTPILRFGQELPVVGLSGSPVEYRVIQLYSRDHGQRRADLIVYMFPKAGDRDGSSGHREFTFDCLPSRTVRLEVLDVDGRGCVAALTIKDKLDHIYPPQAMRLAPDMFFQPQIYRGDGETVQLPDGEYVVEVSRGPEYLRTSGAVTVDATRSRIDVRLQRWIDPAKWGWYSGDTHIHAGGCAHYQNPTEGVSPETMIRHVRGEGLSIGDVLTWGPSYYYQKRFFSGHAVSPVAGLEHPELQLANNATLQPQPTAEDPEGTIRYDVETSHFPSSHAGHLVLLRLKDQDYPGTKVLDDWPSWNLPILRWAQEQGALGGYAHCGSGMVVDSTDLPNYEIPPMDGIGTQEGIVDVTHGVLDFLSGCDTNPVAELNAWYHMMNCGFRITMLGETDWPCITDTRVGTGRSYVRLDQRPVGDSGYEAWIRALKEGRLYCGDGRSHFLDFRVNGHRAGDTDLNLKRSGTVLIEALVAARLEPEITGEITPKRAAPGWGWHLEWARIGKTREVPVELIVNGAAVENATLLADGTPRAIKFKTPIVRSSWVALRIIPSGHTHPVFVMVKEKPIRASKRSAEWCRACVDKVWEVKWPFMRESDRPAAAEAFNHARDTYDRIISECEVA